MNFIKICKEEFRLGLVIVIEYREGIDWISRIRTQFRVILIKLNGGDRIKI